MHPGPEASNELQSCARPAVSSIDRNLALSMPTLPLEARLQKLSTFLSFFDRVRNSGTSTSDTGQRSKRSRWGFCDSAKDSLVLTQG